jgi:hypothetical protein
MNGNEPQGSWLGTRLRRLPIIHYLADCLEGERHREAALVGLNVLMALVLAYLWWGLAALSIVAELLTALVFLILIAVTRG